MGSTKPRRERPPLEPARLEELALRYVGRFATTRAKLLSYLTRKVRERGWKDGSAPDLDAIADRFVRAGFVDDAAYASAKSRSLSGRGYGKSRVLQSLRAAGVDEAQSAEAKEIADSSAVETALNFARRKRIGPFALDASDPKRREKALGAMIRAGHGFELSRKIVNMSPGTEPGAEDFTA